MDTNFFDQLYQAEESIKQLGTAAGETLDAVNKASAAAGKVASSLPSTLQTVSAIATGTTQVLTHLGPFIVGIGLFALGGLMLAFSSLEDLVDFAGNLKPSSPAAAIVAEAAV